MEQNEVVNYYNSIADEYDASRFNNTYGKFIDAEERRVLDDIIDLKHEETRLEVACGTGRLTNYATHGLDASREMLSHARKRHANVEFKEASAASTGYDNAMFDVVYSFHLFMHLDVDTINNIFDEMHRIIRRDGRLIIDIPSHNRRKLLHHKQPTWHGGTELDETDIEKLVKDRFHVKRSYGIMLLPVHKLPQWMRMPLLNIDFHLANGWLKKYSSYLIYELVNK